MHRLLGDNNLLQPEQAQSLFELAKEKNVANAKTYSLLASFYVKRGKIREKEYLAKNWEKIVLMLSL